MDKMEAQGEDIEETFHLFIFALLFSPSFYVKYLQWAAPRNLTPR